MATAREKVRLNLMMMMMWGKGGWLIIMQASHTRATHAPIRVESRSI